MESGFITALLFLKVENMQEESKLLFNIINNLIKKNLKNISYDRTGIVTQVLDNDYLMVSIDKHDFKIKNGTNVGSKKTRNAGENNPNSKLKNSDVIFIRENYIKNHKEFGGVALAKKFGVRRECIYRIIMNKRRVML